MFLIFFALAGFFHTFDQIRSHRRKWSWLPDCLFSDNNWIPGVNILDSFHILKGLAFWMMALGGLSFMLQAEEINLLNLTVSFALAWLTFGETFNLFYHFVYSCSCS